MKLDEISDSDKLFVTLKGIKYKFNEDYVNISEAFHLIGSSVSRRKILLDDIDIVCNNIDLFLNQGFDETDLDILEAKDIYDKLLEIKNKL